MRETLGDLQQSVSDRDASALNEFLADDFIGPNAMDRAGVRRLAQGLFLRHRDIGVTSGPLRIELQSGHAIVRFDAVLNGGSGQVLPDAAQAYDVQTGWREVDGKWKLTSVEWKPAFRPN